MDINQLKTLIHVAELGSLSKASERLHIAQPALSRQIRMLEEELNCSLFERHGRGMVITDSGRLVLEHASRVMAELESIRNQVAEGQSSYSGVISIGMSPTVSSIVAIPLIKMVKASHPRLSLRITSAFTGYLMDRLQTGELDLVVSYDPTPIPSLKIEPVLRETLFLVGGANSDLGPGNPVSFSELGRHELILPSPHHGLRRIIDHCAATAGQSLQASMETDDFKVMLDFVRHCDGATILPTAPIHKFLAKGSLKASPLQDPQPQRTMVLAYPADRPVKPATYYVASGFQDIARKLVADGVWPGELL